MLALHVHNDVEKVCPIVGVSIGRRCDKSTWRIDFRPEATEAQRAAAYEAMFLFKPEE